MNTKPSAVRAFLGVMLILVGLILTFYPFSFLEGHNVVWWINRTFVVDDPMKSLFLILVPSACLVGSGIFLILNVVLRREIVSD